MEIELTYNNDHWKWIMHLVRNEFSSYHCIYISTIRPPRYLRAYFTLCAWLNEAEGERLPVTPNSMNVAIVIFIAP